MSKNLPLRLGLAMWSHNDWQQRFYGKGTKNAERLERYSQVFHTVEGNTTFYASPTPHTVNNWHSATPEDFRFTFKLPQAITHHNALAHSDDILFEFLKLMEPLQEKIGQWTIQLPKSFSPQDLPSLQALIAKMPAQSSIGIEVRHPAFFAKGPEEKHFNQWLMEQKLNRVIMDSRPVFAAPANTQAIIDAQRKKPRVPVHAIVTHNRPMIRFIAYPELERNLEFFAPWLNKLPEWIVSGHQPYLMIHTADNICAPELALTLYQALSQNTALPQLNEFPVSEDKRQLDIFG